MKCKLSALSARYLGALRKHLQRRPGAGLEPARELGRQAVASGLETLDVARIHEQALATMEVAHSQDGVIERAELFFRDVISPIEKTHGAALHANVRLRRLSKALGRRTVDLAASHRSLKQGIARRKTVEVALKKSRGHYQKLLKESRALQKHLQRLTHRILSAQEHSRAKLSHDLQDEIAQTLLGINVRLLTVKKVAGLGDDDLQKEIASTQRLVRTSVKDIDRFTRQFRKRHET